MQVRFMSTSRRFAVPTAFAVAALVVGACSNDPSSSSSLLAPANRPQYVSGSGSGTLAVAELAQGFIREKALVAPVSVTKIIPNSGGRIDIPETDFSLEIPRGAFDAKSMKITVTALPGSVVAYDFQPHGTVFNAPLRFVQKVGLSDLLAVASKAGFGKAWYGAYFAGPSAVDSTTGIAAVNEFLPIDLGSLWSRGEVSFKVWHFSGYMISTGRQCDPAVETCP